MLDFGLLRVDSGSKCGDWGIRLGNSPLGSTWPWLPEGPRVWSYQVPANYKFVARALNITMHNGTAVGILGGSAQHVLGEFKMQVDGVDKFEGRRYGLDYFNHFATGPTATPWKNQRSQPPDMGDGIDFTSTQVVRILFSPSNLAWTDGLANAIFRATFFGVDPVTSAPVILQGYFVSADMAADRVVLSYTVPANGFRLLSWWVDGSSGNTIIHNGMYLTLNGAVIWETGPTAMTSQQCSFRPITFWMDDMEFNPGDRLELFAHPWLDGNHVIEAQLSGQPYALPKASIVGLGGIVRAT